MRLSTARLLGAGLIVIGAVLGYLAVTGSGLDLSAEPTIAIRGVSPDATNDNGQSKLARATDGTLYLAYAAPVDGVEQAQIAFSLDDSQTWKPEITLAQAGVWSDLPAIATGSDGRLDATWVDYVGVGHVWYSSKRDGTWSEQTKISPGPNYAGFPAVVVLGDTAHVVWYAAMPSEETEHGSEYEIEHTALENGEWSTPELLSAGSEDALNPALTPKGEEGLEAAWFQIQNDVYGAHVATLSDGVWASPSLISVPGDSATGVAIASDDDGVTDLVWEQTYETGVGVGYAREDDGVWSRPIQLSSNSSHDPVVGHDGEGRIYVLWSQGGQIVARVHDGDWSDPVSLGVGSNPTLLSGDELLAAWTRQSDAGHELVTSYVAVSTDNTPLLIWGALAVVTLAGGVVLLRRAGQGDEEPAPEIERTDRISGK